MDLYLNISENMVVYPNVIKSHLEKELPFMATETILMDCVTMGGDRQELHEAIRVHSMEAAKLVKEEGKENDLIQRIAQDPIFPMDEAQLKALMDPGKFVGRSIQQVEEYHRDVIAPLLAKEEGSLGIHAEIKI